MSKLSTLIDLKKIPFHLKAIHKFNTLMCSCFMDKVFAYYLKKGIIFTHSNYDPKTYWDIYSPVW